ncbi:MAG: hypothetical protein EON58_02540 [Alphaproteobacteria bacterium]|nr:MAG: hypothetical protein EON58_02540 [Alphaproteobacteria bacterium]
MKDRFIVSCPTDGESSDVLVIDPSSARIEKRFKASGTLGGTDGGLVFLQDSTRGYSLQGEDAETGPTPRVWSLLDRGAKVWHIRKDTYAVETADLYSEFSNRGGAPTFAISPDFTKVASLALDPGKDRTVLNVWRCEDGRRERSSLVRDARGPVGVDPSLVFLSNDALMLLEPVKPNEKMEGPTEARPVIVSTDGTIKKRFDAIMIEARYARGSGYAVAAVPGYAAVLGYDSLFIYRTL